LRHADYDKPKEICLVIRTLSIGSDLSGEFTEDEEPEATPLIPLMEDYETALQDKSFQKLLYSIGVNPPIGAQVSKQPTNQSQVQYSL